MVEWMVEMTDQLLDKPMAELKVGTKDALSAERMVG